MSTSNSDGHQPTTPDVVPTLTKLRERVLAATGPDRDLDWAIYSTVEIPALAGSHWRASLFVDLDGTSAGPDAVDWSKDGLRWYQAVEIERFTASIDAALALVERKLSDCVWTVMTDFGGLCRARIHQHDVTAPTTWQEDGDTPPLAILAALLSALIARGK